jgi:2-phospho-L-lactate guanylyltransferase
MLWALVPVKEICFSKQRLANVLDQPERQGLVLAMLRDVLTAIRGVEEFDGVLLVSRSQEAKDLSRDFVTDTFVESAGSDHSRAVIEGNRYLRERYRAECSIAISGDIPRVTSKDIRDIIRQHDRLTLMPNASGEGTNAIMMSPPNLITCQFGGASLERHVASADAAGLSAQVVKNVNIGHDIDNPRDLELATTDLQPSCTREYLEVSGIAARLNGRNAAQTSAIGLTQGTANKWT